MHLVIPRDQKVWFTSDTHFGHSNIIRYCARKTFVPEELHAAIDAGEDVQITRLHTVTMDKAILKNINDCVGPDDLLFHMGDFAYGRYGSSLRAWTHYREQIQCRQLYLVLGNHDKRTPACKSLFQYTGDRMSLSVRGQVIVLDHYAGYVWFQSHRGSIQLYGHSHGTSEKALNELFPGRRALDVGVDNAYKVLGQYRPFSLDEVLQVIERGGVAQRQSTDL